MASPEEIALLRQGTAPRQTRLACRQHRIATAAKVLVLLICLLTVYLWWAILTGRSRSKMNDLGRADHHQDSPSLAGPGRASSLKEHVKCAVQALRHDTGLDYLKTAHPLNVSEFVSRRDRLAQALRVEGLDAFMVEPGYTFSYYANVTQPDWEVWEPEERPYIMVVRPVTDDDGSTKANTTFLVPSFEAERARLLQMPFEEPLQLVTYEEHWNPYTTLYGSDAFDPNIRAGKRPKIMVDEEMRDFISRGLSAANFHVVGLAGAAERVRQTKSAAEVEILRGVNSGTVEALRAARSCLTPGLIEDDVRYILDATLRAGHLEPFFDIVLFDEDASNPHGGTDGRKTLQNETMVLIDVGAHLYGYSSDVCRSFFPPFLPRPGNANDLSDTMRKKVEIWDLVFDAQTAAMEALHANSTAAAVDIAARDVITAAGYGEAFTHRVGHGIGIKAHESPYLHKGNTETMLREGMVFTAEPGVYLVGEFGVRHEDVFLVREKGLPQVLSGKRAVSPWEP